MNQKEAKSLELEIFEFSVIMIGGLLCLIAISLILYSGLREMTQAVVIGLMLCLIGLALIIKKFLPPGEVSRQMIVSIGKYLIKVGALLIVLTGVMTFNSLVREAIPLLLTGGVALLALFPKVRA